MTIANLTRDEVDVVSGGYPVCTVNSGGTFTPAGGSTLTYSSYTVNSNGSTTLNLTGGGQFTTSAISDPFIRGLYINQACGLPNND